MITNVQKYINNHVEERLSLNEVAAVFGLSPNYLSALFKKSCNIGFSEYITQKKVAKAKALLLEENMKIYEVADMLGFESAFYFSKVFKKVEGISPRAVSYTHLQPHTQSQERTEFSGQPLFINYYPFTPVAATPSTKYFCRDRNTKSTGIRLNTDAAIIRPYSEPNWLMNMRSPNCRVFLDSVVR